MRKLLILLIVLLSSQAEAFHISERVRPMLGGIPYLLYWDGAGVVDDIGVGSMDFDGAGDVVRLPDADYWHGSAGAMSFSFWYRQNSPIANARVFSKGGGGETSFYVVDQQASGFQMIFVDDSGTMCNFNVNHAYPNENGIWEHITVTWNGVTGFTNTAGCTTNIKIYINGYESWTSGTVLIAGGDGIWTGLHNSSDYTCIGAYNCGGGFFIDGQMMNLGVWNGTALSQAQILDVVASQNYADYQTKSNYVAPSAWWNFQTNANDSVGSDHGTQLGDAHIIADYPRDPWLLGTAHPLDTVWKGISTKQTGAQSLITRDISNGAIQISGNKFRIQGSNSGITDTHLYTTITKTLGLLIMETMSPQDNSTDQRANYMAFDATGFDSAPDMCAITMNQTKYWTVTIPNAATLGSSLNFLRGDAITVYTDYQLAFVLGGWDVNHVPYKSGDTKADFLYNGMVFIKGGYHTNWQWLSYCEFPATDDKNTALNFYTGSWLAPRPITIDDVKIIELSDTSPFQPNVLDTFTDTNGDDIVTDHTSELGGAWAYRVGDSSFKIDTNQVELSVAGSNPANNPTIRYAYKDTGLTKVDVVGYVKCDETNGQFNGLMLRGKADTGGGANFFAAGYYGDGSGCDQVLRTVINGVVVDVGTGNTGIPNNVSTLYTVFDDGKYVSVYHDNDAGWGQQGINYTDNTNLTDGDWQGIYAETTSLTNQAFDIFHVRGVLVDGNGQAWETLFGRY